MGVSKGLETGDRYLFRELAGIQGPEQGHEIHISTKAFSINFLAFRSELGNSLLVGVAMIADYSAQSNEPN